MSLQQAVVNPGLAKRDLPNLDLIRSVAVGLVVIPHTLLYINLALIAKIWFLGFLGVAIFFVHTTLVLMWSLERDPHTARFLLRRVFRIYPLWLLVLFFSVAVHLPTSPAYAPAFQFLHPGLKLMVSNILLVFNLSGAGAGLIGASWTLPVEMQMYFVLPFLFFASRSMRSLAALLLLDLLAIAVARVGDPKMSGDLLFCAPCFIPGVFAYVAFQRWGAVFPGWSFLVWFTALILGFNYFAGLHHDSFRSGWAFAILLGASLPLFQQITLRPLVRTAALVARYSYGLYLWHFTAIALGLHYLRGYPLSVRILVYVTTLFVLPVLSYHAVEEPMIKAGSRLARRIGTAREPVMSQGELKLEVAP